MGTNGYIPDSKYEKYDLPEDLRDYLEKGVYDPDELADVVPHGSLQPHMLYSILEQDFETVYKYARNYSGYGVTPDIVNALIDHYQDHPECPWNHECPVPGCTFLFDPSEELPERSQGYYDSLAELHFYDNHAEYEREYMLIHILREWIPKSRLSEISKNVDGNGFNALSHITAEDIVEHHPLVDKSMYEDHFGSWTTAKLEAGMFQHDVGDSVPIDQDEAEDDSAPIHPYSGSEFSYGPDWDEVRETILERDREQCRVCHDDSSELHIHHITPARKFIDISDGVSIDYDAMNDVENLITLCPSCHGRFDDRWEDCNPVEFAERARDDLELE